ncbi:DUF7553 family protein [Haloarcula onubensis]|uniref:Uncharacterized protein n=1 Tax=Haloarcula onubensis TaxID=2950539 RepID=A0ABU2FV14_9EURY|nr:hypothetical protein [Halomicroarcula sp. S3CR25-11]MDS0284610.1 hypothetical protein [Halomicroarcula sp. S3CR25-11]
MVSRLAIARDAVQTASQRTDDATVHEQLQSVDEALEGLEGDAALDDDIEEGSRLEQLEHQLVKLGDDTDGLVEQQLEVARDNVDLFRQERAPDWEGDAD